MDYEIAKVIGEIGANHLGNLEIAKQMITELAKANVDVAKFQKRDNRYLLPSEQYNAPHPVPYNSYGNTYGEHREYLEFNISQHVELYEYCKKEGIIYSTSVWEQHSAQEIVEAINPTMIKVPSACNTDYELLNYLVENYKGELHISLGMTTNEEKENLVKFLKETEVLDRTVLYHTTSGYPITFDDAHLLEIINIKKYGAKAVGFSGHHLGIALDISAYNLGATYIERHFTLDRTWKGTDHAASLEPGGIMRVKRDLVASWKGLTYKDKEICDIEVPQREKLKRIKE